MKIAHISMFYSPTIGGVEQVIKELAERQAKQGHEVHVFCCDSDKYQRISPLNETINNVSVHRMSYWFRLSFNTFFWPSLLWNFKGNFDIIHTHVSGHDYILFGGILSKLIGAKHIHTTHCPWTGVSFRPIAVRPFLFLNDFIMNKIAFKFVDKIIAITPWEISNIEKYSPRKKIGIIPNGTDETLFKKISQNNFKKKYNIKEKKLVLFFGRLNPTKGPEKLALVAREISKKRKDIAFVWLGPDEGKLLEIKKLIKGHKNMHYIPPIRNKKEVAEMYQSADVYTLPSYREGLPLTLFEAMASGLPIVASPVNGIPYEMKEPENGFFADYGDLKKLEENILKILDNPGLAKKISLNNSKKAQQYQWGNISQRYMREYKNLLKDKK